MLVISLGWLSSLMMRWGIWNVFRLGSVSLRGCVIRPGSLWGTPRKFSGEPTSLVVHRRVWCRVCGYAGILRGRLLGWKIPLRVPGVSTPMMFPAG